MAKRLKDVIVDARKQGHTVVVAIDGDHRRVVSIDGKKYRKGSSEGNNELRRIMGEELTTEQRAQRRRANEGDGTATGSAKQREKHKKLPGKAPKLTKAELKRLRKMNAKVRKSGHGFKMTKKQARNLKKRRGKKGFDEQMRRREAASKNAAYNESVDVFIKDLLRAEEISPNRRKYTDRIRKFLAKHGRVGKDNKFRFFKGHWVDDDIFHRAVQEFYPITYHEDNEAAFEEAIEKVMTLLEQSVRVEKKK